MSATAAHTATLILFTQPLQPPSACTPCTNRSPRPRPQDFAILEYRVNMRLDNLPISEMASYTLSEKPGQTCAARAPPCCLRRKPLGGRGRAPKLVMKIGDQSPLRPARQV